MVQDKQANQVNQADARVNILSLIIRLGHESFNKKDLKSKITHILNNSRLISPYDRACLIDYTSGSPKIIGVTGEDSVNHNSEYVILISDLIFPAASSINKITELTPEFINTLPNCEKIRQVHEKYLAKTPASTIFLVPFFPPEGGTKCFIWVVEYFTLPADSEKNKIGLLAQSYSQSIWYSFNSTPALYKALNKSSRHKHGVFIAFICLTLLLLLFIWKINLNVSSDFELISSDPEVDYAPFSGKLAEVYVKNGEFVNKDQLLIKYDTQELAFDLSEAQTSYNETLAKLDMTRQKSFKDEAALPEIRILELQKEKDQIGIEKIRWYIDHSIIKSKIPGRVIIEDEKNMNGKAVNAGEKLVEIVSNDNPIAKILLNEKDAAVLEQISSITLYLHSVPEQGIEAKVISVSPKAEFSDNRQFCFVIKAAFNNKNRNLVYGMRGIARVSGKEVSIGYYFIRNIIIWWRKV